MPCPTGCLGFCALRTLGQGPSPPRAPAPAVPGALLLVCDPKGLEAGRAHFSPSPCPSLPFAGAPAPGTPQPGPCAPGSGRPLGPNKLSVHLQPQRVLPAPLRSQGSPTSAQRVLHLSPHALQTVHPSPPLPRPLVPGPELSGLAFQETNLTGSLSGVNPVSILPGTFSFISGLASAPAYLTPNHSCVPLSGSGRLVPTVPDNTPARHPQCAPQPRVAASGQRCSCSRHLGNKRDCGHVGRTSREAGRELPAGRDERDRGEQAPTRQASDPRTSTRTGS